MLKMKIMKTMKTMKIKLKRERKKDEVLFQFEK